MECGLFLLIILVLLGWYLVQRAPLLLTDGFRAMTSVIAEHGAFTVGCVAGTLSPITLVLVEEWLISSGICLTLVLAIAAGGLFGAVAGIVWALVRDGELNSCAAYGGAGGTIASPLGYGVIMFLAMLFFGG